MLVTCYKRMENKQLEGRGFGVHACGECAHLGRESMALGLGL